MCKKYVLCIIVLCNIRHLCAFDICLLVYTVVYIVPIFVAMMQNISFDSKIHYCTLI